MSLKMARRFCLAAVSLFGVQGMVALLGAAELVIPDLPSPIPFEYGRAIHVNMATLWPLIGTMGLVYYALQEELGRDIFSQRLANWQLWLVVGSALGIYITLAFQIGNGREFFEGLPLFYAGVFLSLVLAAYNVVRTIIRARSNLTPAAAVMTIGIVFLPLLLIPNLMRFSNPIADEVVKFWVVHLWEEMAFELTTSGFIATFIKSLGLAAVPRGQHHYADRGFWHCPSLLLDRDACLLVGNRIYIQHLPIGSGCFPAAYDLQGVETSPQGNQTGKVCALVHFEQSPLPCPGGLFAGISDHHTLGESLHARNLPDLRTCAHGCIWVLGIFGAGRILLLSK